MLVEAMCLERDTGLMALFLFNKFSIEYFFYLFTFIWTEQLRVSTSLAPSPTCFFFFGGGNNLMSCAYCLLSEQVLLEWLPLCFKNWFILVRHMRGIAKLMIAVFCTNLLDFFCRTRKRRPSAVLLRQKYFLARPSWSGLWFISVLFFRTDGSFINCGSHAC